MATADNGSAVTANTGAQTISLDNAIEFDVYNDGAQNLLISAEKIHGSTFATVRPGQAVTFRHPRGIDEFQHKTASSTTTFYWTITELGERANNDS